MWEAVQTRKAGARLGTAIVLALLSLPPLAAEGIGSVHDLAALAYDPVVDAAYGPSEPHGRPSSTGAVGANRVWETNGGRGPFIDEQKEAGAYIQVGLVRGRPVWRAKGWLAIQWALAHQKWDGSFDSVDAVHSATMFLEAAARVSLLEDELGFVKDYQRDKERVVKGAQQLASLDPLENKALQLSAKFTHRLWMMAALLQYTTKLTRDPQYAVIAARYARRAIKQQSEGGSFPEREGYDVGYHAASLLYGARFLAECEDSELSSTVAASLLKGVQWMASRVMPDGSIDSSGSTRVGVERTRQGRIKGIFYGIVAESLASVAFVTRNVPARDLALKIESSLAFRNYYDADKKMEKAPSGIEERVH